MKRKLYFFCQEIPDDYIRKYVFSSNYQFLELQQKYEPLSLTKFDQTHMSNLNLEFLIQKVVDKFQQLKIKKKYQKLYFSSLQLLPINLKVDSLKNYALITPQKINIFLEIEQKMKQKQTLKSELIFLLQDQKIQLQTGKKQVFQCLQQYLITTLEYVENMIQFCQQLSKGQEIINRSLMSKCGRIFIDLHKNLRIQLLKNLISPIEGFDPLLIKSKLKGERNLQMIDIFSQKPQLQNRFIKATEQILTVSNSNKFQQIQTKNISTLQNVLKKYSLSDTETYGEQQKNSMGTKKFSFNIQKSSPKLRQFNNQNNKKKIILNFRKNKIRQNVAKSLDTQSPKFSQTKSVILSNEKILPKQPQKSVIKITEGKNLRSVMLEPLQRKTQRLSLSLHSRDNPITQGENQIKVGQFRLRNKKYPKIQKFSDIGQINQNQTFKSLSILNQLELKPDTKFKSIIKPSRKFLNPITNLKNQSLTPKIKGDFHPQYESLDNDVSLKLSQKVKLRRQSNFTQRILYSQRKIKIEGQAQELHSDKNQKQNVILESAKVQNQQISNDRTIEKKDDHLDQADIISQNQDISHVQTEQFQANQIIPQSGQNIFEQSPPISPQPSGQQGEYSHQSNQLKDIQLSQKDYKKIKTQETKAEQKSDNEKKKILLKAPKLKEFQIQAYLSKFNILDIKDIQSDIFEHQHYINQFFLNQQLFCVVVFSPSLDLRQLHIKLIHQINETDPSQKLDSNTRHRLRKLMINKYVDVLAKSAQNLQQIKFKGQYEPYSWLTQCGFNYDQENFFLKMKKEDTLSQRSSKQFLSLDLSILQIKQSINQSLLYSDDICPYKNGKYDVDQRIFSDNNFTNLQSDFARQIQTIDEVNSILETKQLDTFQTNQNFQVLIQQQKQITDNKFKLNIFTLNQFLTQNFIVSNGWIKTKSTLIFNQKNQTISQFLLDQNYELYFGRGFEHIATMKNKILHHKTKLKSPKFQGDGKERMTKIRMFSKQLYGLIRYENGTAFYGNWEMNFHFKHEYMGKIIYSIEKQTKEDQLLFGESSFFVNIYRGDQFVMGWEVEDSDFLY